MFTIRKMSSRLQPASLRHRKIECMAEFLRESFIWSEFQYFAI